MSLKRSLAIYIGITITLSAGAQPNVNLIPNGSFEQVNHPPHDWFFKGSDFTGTLKDWFSPSMASPDVYGPKIRVPENWLKKGFGSDHALSGDYMVGLTLYGCEIGKPHCREYISVHLAEPTVPSQQYVLELWAKAKDHSMFINNIGILFTEEKINIATDGILDTTPQLVYQSIVSTGKNEWSRLRFSFKADHKYRFLTVGNFSPDLQTMVKINDPETKYGYYYLDDLRLIKIPPIVEESDEFSKWYPLEEGKIIHLQNIHFDFDRYVPSSKDESELMDIMNLMKQYPTLEIEISGHTDNLGSGIYNQWLSEKRARNIRQYLIDQGIESTRMTAVGYSYDHPIADNSSEVSRQQNRRVEIKIIRF